MQKPLNILDTTWRNQPTIDVGLVRNVPFSGSIVQVEIYGDQACTGRPSGAVSEVYAKVSLGDFTGESVSLGDVGDGRGIVITNEPDYHNIEWCELFVYENSESAIVDGVYKLEYGFGTIDVSGREFSFVKQVM